jgi:pimeloyl-ACP methyl ester carboxylesterase
MVERIAYDEFSYFHENAEEFGLPYDGPPTVRREFVEVTPGRRLSALVWGEGPPELVLIHGGAQNAHTWDTVAMALDRPLLAVDLPGHGHSDGGIQGSLNVRENATDVATVIATLTPTPVPVVGMSLGGMTALALTDQHPEVVERLVLVDVTPGVDGPKAQAIVAFIDGPETFPSFEELLARTMEFNPTRSESSLRRGILHNAVQEEDGTWVWRYRRFREEGEVGSHPDFTDQWDAVGRVSVPVMLVRGMRPQAELVRRQPSARIEHVEEAGHSVQGDTPVELAALLDDFIG